MPAFNSIETSCKYCNNKFYIQPNQMARGEGKYCSNMCRSRGQRRPLADRLWEKVDRSGGDESCWPYMTISHDTYGLIYYITDEGKRRTIGAHCAAWFVTHGYLPSDLMVLHKCGYKRCCNPMHLYLGNGHDNAIDAVAEGVWRGNTKITPSDAKAIRLLHGSWTTKQICEYFHITQATLSDIILGKTHTNAGGPIKQNNRPIKSHCHKGHPLVEGNIVYSHGGKNRNCRICYMENNRQKARRRLQYKRAEINAQRRARRNSTIHRFTTEQCAHIRTLYPAHSYRELATMFSTSYSTIQHIIHGTYTGTRFVTQPAT